MFSPEAAARLIGITPDELLAAREAGRLRGVQLNGRLVFSERELREYSAQLQPERLEPEIQDAAAEPAVEEHPDIAPLEDPLASVTRAQGIRHIGSGLSSADIPGSVTGDQGTGDSPGPTPVPGATINDRYELVAEIGSGGMGLVWKAVDAHLRSETQAGFVVLKFLKPQEQSSDAAIERVRQEFQAVRRVHSRNICPVHDFCVHPKYGCFLVMDFVDGTTLKDYRVAHGKVDGTLSVSQTETVVRAVARALKRAHDEGVLHRDIKPTNILISRSGEIRLIDFGLAREMKRDEESTYGVIGHGGTPVYMAVEQLLEEKQTAQSDQYSLAVVAWELLTGRRPFSGGSLSAILQAMVNNAVPDSDIHPPVVRVLKRALQYDRKSRYPTIADFAAAFRAAARAKADSEEETPGATTSKQVAAVNLVAPFDRAMAKASQEAWAMRLQTDVEVSNKLGMRFRLVPPGRYRMGSEEEEIDGIRPMCNVEITRPMLVGVGPVTQQQWQSVMGDNPSRFSFVRQQDTAQFPVENVSWNDAQAFILCLNDRLSLPGWRYRLPTEAEWEYCCRAGSETEFSFGDTLNGQQANCDGSQPHPHGAATGTNLQRPTVVGSYEANAFGLFDMHGNVGEWCSDWYKSKLPITAVTDPAGPATGKFRVVKGGAWDFGASYSRSGARKCHRPGDRAATIGFRVFCERAG